MTQNAAGVNDRINDRSFVVATGGNIASAMVIAADRGYDSYISNKKMLHRIFGVPSSDAPDLHAVERILNAGGAVHIKRALGDETAASGVLVTQSDPVVNLGSYTTTHLGSWGNTLRVRHTTSVGSNTEFGIEVYSTDDPTKVLETFEVSLVPNKRDGYNNPIYIVDVLEGSDYIRFDPRPDYDVSLVTEPVSTVDVTLSGGTATTTPVTDGAIILKWDEFKNTNKYNLVGLVNGGYATPAVGQKITEVAVTRNDCLAFLDVPLTTADSVVDMVDYRKNTLMVDTYHAALFGGWVRIHDAYNNKPIMIPPSADAAARMIALYNSGGQRWEAFAGMPYGVIPNALGVSEEFDEPSIGELYQANINPVVKKGGAAAVIWGQKTLQTVSSSMDRINVVMNVLSLNRKVKEALEPFVFRPKTQELMDNIDFMIRTLAETRQKRGGLYAFNLSVVDGGRNTIDVEFEVQPVEAGEFINLNTSVATNQG